MKPTVDLVTVVECICMNQNETSVLRIYVYIIIYIHVYVYDYIYVYIIIYIYTYIHKNIQNVLGPDGLSLQFLCKAWKTFVNLLLAVVGCDVT